MKLGKIIAGYVVYQTELYEQNAGLFSVEALGTCTEFTVVIQTEFFRAIKHGNLTKIGIGITNVL